MISGQPGDHVMQPLPYSYSRCYDHKDCPLAARCLRTVPTGPGIRDTLVMFPGDVDCSGFIGEQP